MFPSALLPFCPSSLLPFCPPVGRNCGKSPLHVNMSAVAAQKMGLSLLLPAANAEKRCSEVFSLPMRPWKWTKTAISLPHRQEFAYGMAFFRNCGGRAVQAPFPGGGRWQEIPVSGRIVAGWPRFRANGGLPVTGRPGSGGFACREGESRSRGVGRLDSSANRSFHKRTCNHSQAGFLCR